MWAILFMAFLAWLVIYIAKKGNKSYLQTQADIAAKMYGSKPVKRDENIVADIENLNVRTEAMIQSMAVGDEATYQAIMNETYQGPWPERRGDGGWLSMYDNLRILKIAGINYRKGIASYTGRVMSALVPEPDNEYDSDAIKIVAEDRHHLGYIPTDQTDFVRSMTGGQFPYRCECHIYQGDDETDGHRFYYGFVYIKRKDKGE